MASSVEPPKVEVLKEKESGTPLSAPPPPMVPHLCPSTLTSGETDNPLLGEDPTLSKKNVPLYLCHVETKQENDFEIETSIS